MTAPHPARHAGVLNALIKVEGEHFPAVMAEFLEAGGALCAVAPLKAPVASSWGGRWKKGVVEGFGVSEFVSKNIHPN